VIEPIKLLPWFAIPLKAKPLEVLKNAVVVFRSYPGVVDVLKTNPKTSSFFSGEIMGHPSRVGVAEVETSGGAGGKAGYGHFGFKKY
jgi:hypothetical protein